MVIFYSYVKLPEGILYGWLLARVQTGNENAFGLILMFMSAADAIKLHIWPFVKNSCLEV